MGLYDGQSHDNLQALKKTENLLCAAVGTISHPHVLCMLDVGHSTKLDSKTFYGFHLVQLCTLPSMKVLGARTAQ